MPCLTPPPPSPLLHLHTHSAQSLSTAANFLLHLSVLSPHHLSNLCTILFTNPSPHLLKHLSLHTIPILSATLPHITFLPRTRAPTRAPNAALVLEFADGDDIDTITCCHTWLNKPRIHHRTIAALLDTTTTPTLTHTHDNYTLITTRTTTLDAIPPPSSDSSPQIRLAPSLIYLPPPPPPNTPHPLTDALTPRSPHLWLALDDLHIALPAHKVLRNTYPSALLLLVPSTTPRPAAAQRAAVKYGFTVSQITHITNATIAKTIIKDTAVCILDQIPSFDLLHALYEAASVVLIGSSFARRASAHCSFVPAALRACCVMHGPNVDALRPLFAEVREELVLQRLLPPHDGGGGEDADEVVWNEPFVEAFDEDDISQFVDKAWRDQQRTSRLGEAFQKAVEHLAKLAELEVVHVMDNLMPRTHITTDA